MSPSLSVRLCFTYHSFTFVSARFEALLRLDSRSISGYLSMRYGALVSAIDVKRTWLYLTYDYFPKGAIT